MHKNFRNSNKPCVIIDKLLNNFSFNKNGGEVSESELDLPIFERKNVKFLIEKRVKLVGDMLPIHENKIRTRLINFIKQNRIAMRHEQACCRYVKQFYTTAFLLCELCNGEQDNIEWLNCKYCGYYNNYRI